MADSMSEILTETQKLEDALMGFETEAVDSENTDLEAIPYSAESIRISSMMYSIYQIYHWTEEGILMLQPEYQRNQVWDIQRKSLLIESLMIRIPIPVFYFQEDAEGDKTVIDGLQRLSTICSFLKDEFSLKNMQYLREFNGYVYSQLPKKYRTRILETQLSVNVLDSRCNELVKFDVFRRVNTGGVPLNSQEIRNIMAAPKVRRLLRQMSTCEEFIQATRGRVKDTRMGAQELCLRYILFCYKYDAKKKQFKDLQPLNGMMDLILTFLNNMEEKDLDVFLQMFRLGMARCYALLGDEAFSKETSRHIINKPLFISWSVVLTSRNHSLSQLFQKRDEAVRLCRAYYQGGMYYNAITSSTTSRRNLALQFEAVEKILEELGL